MNGKTDSGAVSLAVSVSSPTRSPPRRPVYFLRDSHDGEKSTMSFHSTPVLSPTGSPLHSQSVGHPSCGSSSSRFSGSVNPGARRVSGNGRSSTVRRKSQNPGKECDVAEGLAENEEVQRSRSRRCYLLLLASSFRSLSSPGFSGVSVNL